MRSNFILTIVTSSCLKFQVCARLVDRIFVQISGVCDQNLFFVILHIIVRSYYRSFYKSFGGPGVPSEKISRKVRKMWSC